MCAVPLPSRLVTFCFTDVEGSTRLFHEPGDRRRAVLEQHNAIIRAVTSTHSGAEVKTEGDAFFLAFGDAAAAVGAYADVQRELKAASPACEPEAAARGTPLVLPPLRRSRPCLRLRVRGGSGLLPAFRDLLAARADVLRVQVDTYVPEVGRYRGPAHLAASERVFAADSCAVVALLPITPAERWRLAAAAVDRWAIEALEPLERLRGAFASEQGSRLPTSARLGGGFEPSAPPWSGSRNLCWTGVHASSRPCPPCCPVTCGRASRT